MVDAPDSDDRRPSARSRLPGRGVLAVGLVVAVIVAAGALWLTRGGSEPGPGPLYNANNDDYAFPVPAGRPVMYGVPVVRNKGKVPATLVAAEPARATPGLRVIDVLAAGAGRGGEFFAGDRRFPPRPGELRGLRPLAGAVVPPDSTRAGSEGVELVFGLQMDGPGRYVIDGIRVRYRVGDEQHEEVFAFRLAACAGTGADATEGDCALPDDA